MLQRETTSVYAISTKRRGITLRESTSSYYKQLEKLLTEQRRSHKETAARNVQSVVLQVLNAVASARVVLDLLSPYISVQKGDESNDPVSIQIKDEEVFWLTVGLLSETTNLSEKQAMYTLLLCLGYENESDFRSDLDTIKDSLATSKEPLLDLCLRKISNSDMIFARHLKGNTSRMPYYTRRALESIQNLSNICKTEPLSKMEAESSLQTIQSRLDAVFISSGIPYSTSLANTNCSWCGSYSMEPLTFHLAEVLEENIPVPICSKCLYKGEYNKPFDKDQMILSLWYHLEQVSSRLEREARLL